MFELNGTGMNPLSLSLLLLSQGLESSNASEPTLIHLPETDPS